MARCMPSLAQAFADSTDQAVNFARGLEAARTKLTVAEAQSDLPVHRVELAYELTYLRAFTAWETFLEETFLRYLCGYEARHGRETPVSGSYCTTLENARQTLYGNQQFLLWHSPTKVTARAARYFRQSRIENVIASMQGRIEQYAAIRHRIAHAHADNSFDAATMALSGRRYRGSRPGRFLRDWAPHSQVPTRWIDIVMLDFRGLAFQIAPP